MDILNVNVFLVTQFNSYSEIPSNKFYVLVTVHREHKVKRENQQDATNSILFLSFRRVLNVIYSFLGNSPASEF